MRRSGKKSSTLRKRSGFLKPISVRSKSRRKAQEPDTAGFLTGYYEPVVDGSLTPTRDFSAPVLARPDNLTCLTPYLDRAAIEAGGIDDHVAAVVWLRDQVEVFLVQVQGSARVHLADGRVMRLVYAGRNGHAYSSIGRILIESGEIAETDMSLAALKQWICAHGQNPGDAGLALMQRNRSYVFFALQEESDPACGPTGGQGIGLTPLRSIAVDRTIWTYGLPFWIEAGLPWRSSLPFAVPASHDRAGHGLGDYWSRPRRYFLWLRG